MSWTVRARLIALGILIFAVVGVVTSATLYSNATLHSALELRGLRDNQTEKLHQMASAINEVMLAAMDSLVDADEGSIQPERTKIIADGLKILAQGQAELIKDADQESERQFAQKY
jgi:methyl-accepting chemotaxis protein